MAPVGFEQDINNMLFSYRAGAVSETDFELLMAAEHKRSTYAIQISDKIRNEIEDMFTLYDRIADCMSKKIVVPNDVSQAIFSIISKTMLTVKNFQRIVKSSSLTIGSCIISAESELTTFNEGQKPISIADLLAVLSNLELNQKKPGKRTTYSMRRHFMKPLLLY